MDPAALTAYMDTLIHSAYPDVVAVAAVIVVVILHTAVAVVCDPESVLTAASTSSDYPRYAGASGCRRPASRAPAG